MSLSSEIRTKNQLGVRTVGIRACFCLQNELFNAQQNSNALRQYKHILRSSEPNNEFLLEAAEFYDRIGLDWDANNARERITQ